MCGVGVGTLGMPVGWYVAMGGADGIIAMGGAGGIIAMACCCWYAMGGSIVGGAVGGAGLYCGIMGGRICCT